MLIKKLTVNVKNGSIYMGELAWKERWKCQRKISHLKLKNI